MATAQRNVTGRKYGDKCALVVAPEKADAEDASEDDAAADGAEIKDRHPQRRPVAGTAHIAAVPLADRFGVSLMTVNRWLVDPRVNLPQPYFVGQRRYWNLAEIEAWEKTRAAASAHAPQGAAKKAGAAMLERLKQEVAAAPSRTDALAILCAAAFPALPDGERAQASGEIADILSALPEAAA